MTGYGFCGPMTAMGTVFDPKEEGAASRIRRGAYARGRSRGRGRRAVMFLLSIWGV